MPSSQGAIDAMNNQRRLSKPMLIMVHTVGDAVAINLALSTFVKGAARNGEAGIAERLTAINNSFVESQPEDWDCGDPDCEACSESRLERGDVPQVDNIDPLIRFILNGRTEGEA